MSRARIGLLAAIAVAAGAAIPSAALGGASASSTRTVTLREFRFHPAALTINRGDRVMWVWRDEVEHNVTFHSFHSRTQEHGTYTVRFNQRGTFKYRCTIHGEEGMRGKIVVR